MTASIVVGVGAGIAAYKAAILVRELIRSGARVDVVPTPRSLEFVGKATWEGLTGRPVHVGVFDHPGSDHVELARRADLVVVAPATADLMARVRAGIADDLLTTTILAASCPVLLAPAMHSAMWTNPATQDNVRELRARGFTVIEPEVGALGSGDSGIGRLPDPSDIAARAFECLGGGERRLAGRRILVSAGGTREPVDPVRFIGNRSSGRQGIEIARAAADEGADVVLVAANIEEALLAPLAGRMRIIDAPTAADVEAAVLGGLADLDAVVMTAAVADFRPVSVETAKIKKDPDSSEAPTLVLERTVDVLKAVCDSDSRPALVVGFAAETGTREQVEAFGRDKACRKGADLLAVNRVGEGLGFGDVDNEVLLLDSAGRRLGGESGSKAEVARFLVGMIAKRLDRMAQ